MNVRHFRVVDVFGPFLPLFMPRHRTQLCADSSIEIPVDLSPVVVFFFFLFTGFLPRVDPLRRLPQLELQPWEAMAVALPSLLAVGRARKPLEALPELSIGELTAAFLAFSCVIPAIVCRARFEI